MNTQTVLIVAAIILIAFVVYPTLTKEGFEEMKQKDVTIKPLLYEKETGIITAGSEFAGVPEEIMLAWGEEDKDGLYDGEHGSLGLHYNMCSKSCCSAQYPPAFGTEYDAMVCKNKDKFVPNSYKCNNAWQDSGCVCMTHKQREFLLNRGGNA